MSSANFQDPVGLFFRMLRSGNRTAYFILFREALGILLTPLDWLLQFRERKLLKKANPQDMPVLLIVGGSRSGTTLIYQILSQHLPVSIISNLVASFERSPITAYKLFHGVLRKPRAPFKNYYGSAYGHGAPNDAFPMWNRWMGSNRNRIVENIGPDEQKNMRQFIDAWHQATGKPLLNKNNRNSLCMPLLRDSLSNVFFIEIHRDPIYVAQSLVFSRKAVQGAPERAWGLLGQEASDDGDPLSHIDKICEQVYAVDKIIKDGRSQIDPAHYYRISYERFCEDPAGVVKEIAAKALGIELSAGDLEELKPLKNTNKQRLEDAAFHRIGKCIADLYGKDSVSGTQTNTIKESLTPTAGE